MLLTEPDKWSKFYDQCIVCNSSLRPHKGKGHCTQCYHRVYQRENKAVILRNLKRWRYKNRDKYNAYQNNLYHRKKNEREEQKRRFGD